MGIPLGFSETRLESLAEENAVRELRQSVVRCVVPVADAAAACAAVRAKGGTVAREAGPVKGGTTVIAFVQDPDGYKIELIETRKAS